MKFKKNDNNLPQIYHEGYLTPTHYLIFGDQNSIFRAFNMYNTASNVFIGKRKYIEKLIKQIIHHKSESKEDYFDNDFFITMLWDNHKIKDINDILMLATFENTDTYTIKLPLNHYFTYSKELLVLAEDNNRFSCPLMVLDNIQKKYKENKLLSNKKIYEELLKSAISPHIFSDFKYMEMLDSDLFNE